MTQVWTTIVRDMDWENPKIKAEWTWKPLFADTVTHVNKERLAPDFAGRGVTLASRGGSMGFDIWPPESQGRSEFYTCTADIW